MKESILSNWNIIRILRLVLGLAIIAQAVVLKDTFLGVAGLLFSTMALFNIGCCGPSGCAVPAKRSDKTIEDTTYEEVDGTK